MYKKVNGEDASFNMNKKYQDIEDESHQVNIDLIDSLEEGGVPVIGETLNMPLQS